MNKNIAEEASRPVSLIKFSFPKGLVGISDIHSQSQLQGLLTSFGRGVVDAKGNVKIGPVGSSHAGLGSGMSDPKRFYFGYNKETQTVHLSAKNGMDVSFIKNQRILPIILSNIFDMYKLSISQGKKLQFQESQENNSMSAIDSIAKKELGIETLETRHSDDLDFYDLSVWQIKSALQKAYMMGKSGAGGNDSGFTEAVVEDFVHLKKLRLDDF